MKGKAKVLKAIAFCTLTLHHASPTALPGTAQQQQPTEKPEALQGRGHVIWPTFFKEIVFAFKRF